MREMLFAEGTISRRYGEPVAPPFIGDLFEACEQNGLSGSSASWAWEFTGLEPDLDHTQRRDLSILFLVSLLALREGSTRLPLRGESVSWLHGAVTNFDADPVNWHTRVQALLENLPHLVGLPGDYVPLIIEGDWLYHQRIHVYEERFAKVVARRLVLGHGDDGQDTLEDHRRPRGRRSGPSTGQSHRGQASGLPGIVEVDDALQDVLARPAGGVELEGQQLEAVRLAASTPLSVVTGGPGTGKTTIVVSVLRVLMRLGILPDAVALAAPTGKAANRLGESIEQQLTTIAEPADEDDALQELVRPSTLHRLLRYSRKKGTFFHDANNPLPYRWVIVDEASMIDLVLMERLMASLRDDANIVLLGDAEQLPSVDTGTILRDLIPFEGAPNVVRLVHSHRVRPDDPESGRILDVAKLVREGRTADLLAKNSPMRRCEANSLSARGVDFVGLRDDIAPVRTLLEDWSDTLFTQELDQHALLHVYRVEGGAFGAEDQAKLRTLFEHLSRARILCLTRVFPTGANAINTYFHRKIALRANVSTSVEWVTGEPVLMLSNDYDRGLFNGDQGIVVRAKLAEEAESLVVVFAQGPTFKAFHLNSLRAKLDRAFAMTVHKSQGSEFDRVLLVLPTEPIPLLSREIIYTAITRAREHAVIVGPEPILKAGVEAKIQRFSGVRERLLVSDA